MDIKEELNKSEYDLTTYQVEQIIKLFSQHEIEVRDSYDKMVAYCSCGDSLERSELYPNEAKYSCFGCDKTYKLALLEDK